MIAAALVLSVVAAWPATGQVPAAGPPQAIVIGPAVPTDGLLYPFSVSSFGVQEGFASIVQCGNADAAGNPLPATAEFDQRTRCIGFGHGITGLYPGPFNRITGQGIMFGAAATEDDVTSGSIEWQEPMLDLLGNEIRCIEDGNFPCAVFFNDGDETTVVPLGNDLGLPTITAGAGSIVEGDEGYTMMSIPITIDAPVEWPITVTWAPIPDEADYADFFSYYEQVVIPPGETATEALVYIRGDIFDENDEGFWIQIGDPIGAEIGGFFGLGRGTIIDDDDPPAVVPEWADTLENDGPAVVALRLTEPSGKPITVDWQTASWTATAGEDFVDAAGQVTFEPGVTSQFVFVDLLDDDDIEDHVEHFGVVTSNYVNVRPGGFYGVAFVGLFDDERDCTSELGPGADLRFCDLSGETLSGIDLSGADLRGANLTDTILVDVDLTGANLSHPQTEAVRTSFLGVDLTDAEADGANLDSSVFINAELAGFAAVNAALADTVFVGSSLAGADLTAALLAGTTVVNSDATDLVLTEATVTGATFLPTQSAGMTLLETTWGSDTVCPDGTVSGDHRNTCWRVPIEFAPPHATVSLFEYSFDAVIFDSHLADPLNTDYYARFGPAQRYSISPDVVDIDNDGQYERTYSFATADAGLTLGTREYCVTVWVYNYFFDEEAERYRYYYDEVYGCADLTVTDVPPPTTTLPPISPPASPPASPPSSPPASGPISGVSNALSGLVPLLSGPVGLMLTASGVGFIFLMGSNRASTSLRGETRKDDDEQHDD